jgi:hydroxymethylbilane synthase
VPLRGNVETRLKKLDAGEVDATILSSAGLHRLGLDHVGTVIPFDIMLPAPGQGALGIECRADDDECMQLLKLLDDSETRCLVMAERAFVRALGGSCHSPVGTLTALEKQRVRLTAEILSEDGKERLRDEAEFPAGKEGAAEQLARAMLERAPEAIRRLFAGA